ncbi:biotin/lipoyl-binding protein [Cuneatibacter sp. NSJ-177]|uniref:biotin/lipoyl-containing protein n=1 Tax=Cuneatibacter sp. NSJ-177 TaxID=2931401 RepID=UPI001FD09D7A|nr:biotin/lipoyl-containing protein [Cuneatibacter sp. NSJ-177]MCJ7835050.1 biotin/lipoyl-binding protein [Cuneatibacter sp. NSJ-177]
MEIKTRVPGVITEVKVKEGDHVDVKTQVATIEAMKMFQPVLSPVAGIVAEVLVEEDQRVKGGDVLVVIEE